MQLQLNFFIWCGDNLLSSRNKTFRVLFFSNQNYLSFLFWSVYRDCGSETSADERYSIDMDMVPFKNNNGGENKKRKMSENKRYNKLRLIQGRYSFAKWINSICGRESDLFRLNLIFVSFPNEIVRICMRSTCQWKWSEWPKKTAVRLHKNSFI